MKKLIQNFNYNCCSEVVEHSYGEMKLNKTKFKIVAENGNCYSKLKIYILNSNGLQEIANEQDIPGYAYVEYVDCPDRRLAVSKANVFAAEDYIKKIFK